MSSNMFKRLRDRIATEEFSRKDEMIFCVGKKTPTFGEISFHQNRFCWKIPKFQNFIKDANLIIYSPEFFLGDRYCHLFAVPWRFVPGSAQSQFLIGAWDDPFRFFANKNPELSVRFGITGRSAELSIFGVHYGKGHVIQRKLLGHSEFENYKQEWVSDGNLHLFIAVEGTAEKPKAELSPQTFKEIGK